MDCAAITIDGFEDGDSQADSTSGTVSGFLGKAQRNGKALRTIEYDKSLINQTGNAWTGNA